MTEERLWFFTIESNITDYRMVIQSYHFCGVWEPRGHARGDIVVKSEINHVNEINAISETTRSSMV